MVAVVVLAVAVVCLPLPSPCLAFDMFVSKRNYTRFQKNHDSQNNVWMSARWNARLAGQAKNEMQKKNILRTLKISSSHNNITFRREYIRKGGEKDNEFNDDDAARQTRYSNAMRRSEIKAIYDVLWSFYH